ncbi:MAG: aspartate--tRNA(Asn) ligase [Roseiflexaceae bacterium]|nr:aspartate--tRNA(Asn) ligase [Roseiflexaceae bacterium]
METVRIWSSELGQHVGEQVRLSGWVHRLRELANVSFLILRDAKGLAQIVVEDRAVAAQLGALHAESVVHVVGTVVAVPQAPGGVELHAPAVELVSASAAPPPFDMFRPTIKAQLPTILDHAPLALRHPRHRAIFQLSAASMRGFRETLRGLDFTEIQTPKIVASATEGGANVFAIEYFGQKAYLAQSPQFYKQTMVGVFERVFEVAPVFRAEPHDTPRHLNEYVSLDCELGFIRDHRDVQAVLTQALAGMVAGMQQDAADALALLKVRLPAVPAKIPAIHFSEALELIFRETGEDARHEPDLAPAHERWLGEWARTQHGSDFLFVWGYPLHKRPFYTHPDPDRPGYSNGFDLLFRGLELVTGGQRLHRYADYLAALAERGLPAEPFEGYLMAFKYGMPPHGGFAIGLERWLARLIEAPNVRETTLFPRDLNRLAP